MIERLTNCPNCAGILNEAGRCAFCGSKVFDFLSIDFSGDHQVPSAKTYIKIKVKGKTILAPIIVRTADIEIKSNPIYARYDDGAAIIRGKPETNINLYLNVTGDIIQIDAEEEE